MTDSPKSTPQALIAAALHLFGHRGYEGTSTRAIAERAGTNVASIGYHFGGKEGLRMACARAIAARVSGVVDAEGAGAAAHPQTPAEAEAAIERAVHGLVALIVAAPEAEDMVAFIVRELTEHGPVAEMIFSEFLLPRHRRLCALWAAATGGDAEDPEVKLAVFATIGQVFYFRVAQPFVARRMGWAGMGAAEADKIAAVALANLRAQRRRQR
jgi:TetR/AcrR family transcriptional regulator, regulator of cefoperazone and chloramphenicol sensitivity